MPFKTMFLFQQKLVRVGKLMSEFFCKVHKNAGGARKILGSQDIIPRRKCSRQRTKVLAEKTFVR